MSRPTFVARTRANPYGVFVVNDYEAFQVGTSPTGVAEHTTTSGGNSVIQVRNELYMVGGGVLFQYNKTTTDWDTIYHPVGLAGTNRHNSGLFYVRIANEPYVCWICNNPTTNSYRGIKFNLNTRVATEVNGTGGVIATTHRQQSFLFGGSIFWNTGAPSTGASPCIYNPGSNTIGGVGTVSLAAGANSMATYTVFNKNLYLVTLPSQWCIYRYNGSGFIALQFTGTTAVNNATHHAQYVFTDRTNLYIIVSGALENFSCFKMDANETITDITSSVLPAEWSGNTSASTRGWLYVDNEDDTENPKIYLYFGTSATAGVSVGKWQWNGESNKMTLVGIGGDVSYRWSDDQEGGGHRSYTANEMDALVQKIEASTNVGASKITFNIFESPLFPSGTPVAFRLAYDADFEHPRDFASLINPLPSGTIVNGDMITGIIAGSGINYSVEWRPTLDGLSPGQRVRLIPWVSGIV